MRETQLLSDNFARLSSFEQAFHDSTHIFAGVDQIDGQSLTTPDKLELDSIIEEDNNAVSKHPTAAVSGFELVSSGESEP